jgi:hypothetical protein
MFATPCMEVGATMPATELEIYLDMDGVCVDFVTAAIEAHGFDAHTILEKWDKEYAGEFVPHKVLGLEADTFWDHLASLGEPFWIDLRPYAWFEELLAALKTYGHVVFLSAPAWAPCCVSGKLTWLQSRFGHPFQDYIFTPHKGRLAHSRAVLVDDYDPYIDAFTQRGGTGVLFPQIWNTRAHVTNRLESVLEEVRRASLRY